MFRRLSLAYGWSPDTIARMTPAQLLAYTADDYQTMHWMTPAEARAFRASLRVVR